MCSSFFLRHFIYYLHILSSSSALKYPDKYPGFGAAPSPLVPFDQLPTEFNWCAHPSGGCTASWNQHIPKYFPLCYLHATLSMAQDRIRHLTSSYGIPDVHLSRQDILDCGDHFGYGQDDGGGGEGVDVLEYMRQVGLPDETCNIFQGDPKKCDPDARCMNCMMLNNDKNPHCWPVERYVKYRVKDYGFLTGEQAMMSEILARGPITCGLALAGEDFTFGYRGGVHIDRFNATDVDHEIEVVGWTERPHPDPAAPKDAKIRAWVIRNSWGTYVGHNGFALIERGVNAMRIEEQCIFANFDVSELDAHLRGETVGSMFGLVDAGTSPRMTPRGWKNMEHDFMTEKEIKKEAEEVVEHDNWISSHIAKPELTTRGSMVLAPGTVLEDTESQSSSSSSSSSSSTPSKPKKADVHKVSTTKGFLLLFVAFGLGMGLMLLLAHLNSCAQENEEYESIPTINVAESTV